MKLQDHGDETGNGSMKKDTVIRYLTQTDIVKMDILLNRHCINSSSLPLTEIMTLTVGSSAWPQLNLCAGHLGLGQGRKQMCKTPPFPVIPLLALIYCVPYFSPIQKKNITQ